MDIRAIRNWKEQLNMVKFPDLIAKVECVGVLTVGSFATISVFQPNLLMILLTLLSTNVSIIYN